jgi:hypothetical protein
MRGNFRIWEDDEVVSTPQNTHTQGSHHSIPMSNVDMKSKQTNVLSDDSRSMQTNSGEYAHKDTETEREFQRVNELSAKS